MPSVAIILIVFACALALSRCRVPLGIALVVGGLTLDICGGHSPGEAAGHLADALAAPRLWMLLAVVVLITELGRFMTKPENAGELTCAIARFGGRHSRALSLMGLPAVIGLIPMPGGALFSAPFVEQLTAGREIGALGDRMGDWKNAVNYWFRHVVEHWWPLYPGVVVALSLFQLDVWRFISTQILFTPVAVLAGYLILVRPHLADLAVAPADRTPVNRPRLFLLVTMLATVILYAVLCPPFFKLIIPGLDGSGKMNTEAVTLIALLAGLVMVSVMIIADERKSGRSGFLASAFKRPSLETLLTVAGVLVFQSLLNKSMLVERSCGELNRWGIPPAVAVALLPMLAGFVTGIAMGFAGASFPLVVALMHSTGMPPLATMALAYGFGHTGMMLSPVHVCIIVSKNFFKASLTGSLLRILPCSIVMAVFSIILHILLRRLSL